MDVTASGCPAVPLTEKPPPVDVAPASVVLKLRSNPPPVWAVAKAADKAKAAATAARTVAMEPKIHNAGHPAWSGPGRILFPLNPFAPWQFSAL